MFGTPKHPREPSERDQAALIARATVLADHLAEASEELASVVRDLQVQTTSENGAPRGNA